MNMSMPEVKQVNKSANDSFVCFCVGTVTDFGLVTSVSHDSATSPKTHECLSNFF